MTFDPDEMRQYAGPQHQPHLCHYCKARQPYNKELLNPFLSSELIIYHTFLQGKIIKAALTDYPSICKPLYYLKKELAISPFHVLIVDHFWDLPSVGSTCSNTINAFLE